MPSARRAAALAQGSSLVRGVAGAIKSQGGSFKEFADFQNLTYTVERERGKGKHRRTERYTFAVSRGDWLAIAVLVLGWEAANAIASGLAGLDPLTWAQDVGTAIQNDIQTYGGAVNSHIVSEPGLQPKTVTTTTPTTTKLGPPSGNPTTVGSALQYHILRGNAKYQLARGGGQG